MIGYTSNGEHHKRHTHSLSDGILLALLSVHGACTGDSLEVLAAYLSRPAAVPQQAWGDLPPCQPPARLAAEGSSLPRYRTHTLSISNHIRSKILSNTCNCGRYQSLGIRWMKTLSHMIATGIQLYHCTAAITPTPPFPLLTACNA